MSRHLAEVAATANAAAAPFGGGILAAVAGQLHDIGKCSERFQSYIAGEGAGTGGDHSSAGAIEALAAYPGPLGRALAFCIAGHHAGLADGRDLDERLAAQRDLADYAGWRTHAGPLPKAAALGAARLPRGPQRGFSEAFRIRMLFSALVDADSLETERFHAQAKNEPVGRGGHATLEVLRDRLRGHLDDKRAGAPANAINRLRAEVLDHAMGQAALPTGLFTLTVPTGGGKTLASLAFALEHALRHGLRRVVYVIPFTSIIEQTAQVFREAFGTGHERDVLEHHASFDWDAAGKRDANADDEGHDGIGMLRRAAENWDVPIVVTTGVQFFESLFAAKRSRCRKLHNLGASVIVLDEAQTLPIGLLRPCIAAIDELARHYRASVVLCTATQPALRKQDKFEAGLDIPDARELAPEPARLYAALRRVRVERLDAPIELPALVERFAAAPQMLCIVNTRKRARQVFDAVAGQPGAGQPGAVHLTTLMCPRHRRSVLSGLRERLKAGEPVRLVATSLIEAGVDISFPEVWRETAGLDSVAQAAGRCNREGGEPLGRVVVFDWVDGKAPPDLVANWQAGMSALRRHAADPLGLDAVRGYFGDLYWQKGADALDTAKVAGRPGILVSLAERARSGQFEFASIAAAFRMIEEAMQPVIVPWQADAADTDARDLLARIGGMERPRADDLRRLQQYTVPIPSALRGTWLAQGVLKPVHISLPAVLCFGDLAHYRAATGLDILDPDYRRPEDNLA